MKTRPRIITILILTLLAISAIVVFAALEKSQSPDENGLAVTREKAVEIAVTQFKDIEVISSSAKLETVNSSVYLKFPGTATDTRKLVWIVTVEGKPEEWLRGGQVYIDAANGDVLLVGHVM